MDGGSPLTHATDVFTNIAFRQPKCGDCGTLLPPRPRFLHLADLARTLVIQALMKASGTLGLEAFLPSPERALPLAQEDLSYDDNEVPHLPLTPRWEDGQFSLLSVMGASRELNVRAWTLRLLQRYRFVIGTWLPKSSYNLH